MADRSFAWYHSDSGVLPEVYRDPWTLTGAGSSLAGGALRMADTSAVNRLTYTRQLFEADRSATLPRYRDWVWFQIRVRGVSSAPAWASGVSPIGFWIDDGGRALGVSIGSDIQLIDPYTGAITYTAQTAFPWLFDHVFLLLKAGPERWVLWIDGKLAAVIPYNLAVASAGAPGVAGFGSMDPVGLSEAYFDQPELGLNQATPPQWKVDRLFGSMPVALQARWNEMARAAMRATIGLFETPLRLLEDVWRDLTAWRLDENTHRFSGARLPSLEKPPWTLINAGQLVIERERLRMNATGLAATGVRATVPPPATGLPVDVEYTLRATWTVRAYTPDAQGRVGPYMQIANGHATITAQLVEVVAGESWAWVLTTGTLVGAITTLGTVKWRVDITQAHEVEIQVLGRARVLLIVNKRIVDRLAYSIFPAGVPFQFDLASPGAGAGPVATILVENALAVRRFCDLTRRSLFLQNAVERLIFVGGCERNDEIETWMQHHFEVQELRGTTQGIIVEMRRLACNEDCFVVADKSPTQWYLELTYPEVTPIWLELAGELADVFVEFGIGSINFSPQELADLAARYLVPTSVIELQYYICLAARLTANSSVPAPGTTRVTVTNTEGFVVGDAITIRNPTNTVSEGHVVSAIVSATLLEMDETTFAPFPTNSVIRKVLATT